MIVADGVDPAELAIVVVDPVISFATQPVDFALHIETGAPNLTEPRALQRR